MNRPRNLSGEFFTPEILIELISALCDKIPASKILDPACGRAELLIAAAGNKKDITLNGVDINQDAYSSAENLLRNLNRKYQLWNEDFFKTELDNDFDLIVCNPPFVKQEPQEVEGLRWGNPSNFIIRSLQLLKEDGCAIFVIPDIFLLGEAYKKPRNFLLEKYSLRAVISLSSNTFSPFSSIKTSVLILKKSQQSAKIFFARLSRSTELKNIIKSFHRESENKNLLQGFWVSLEQIKESSLGWQYEYHKNLKEFEVKRKISKYPLLLLKNLILEDKKQFVEGNSLLIQRVSRTPRVFMKDEVSDDKNLRRCYIEININSEKILPQYLKLYLNSEQGKKQLAALCQNMSLLLRLESIKNVQIEVPSIDIQSSVIETFQKLAEISVKIQALESRFYRDLIDCSELYSLVEKFYQLDQEDISFEDLICPLATSFRIATKCSPSANSRLDSYFKTFEMITKLNSVVLLSALPKNLREEKGDEIWGNRKEDYQRPSFGKWVELYRNLSVVYKKLSKKSQESKPSILDDLPFGKDFYLQLINDEILTILNSMPDKRNRSTAHGPIISDSAAQQMADSLHGDLMKIFIKLNKTYAPLNLIYPYKMKMRSELYEIDTKHLQGTRYPYAEDTIITEFPINTELLYLYNPFSKGHLGLIPDLINLQTSESSGNLSIYFYHKADKGKAHYISYHNELHENKCLPGNFLKSLFGW